MKIEVSGLTFAYTQDRPVLKGLSFSAGSGDFLCVMGPNGAGKSTLFRCLLGLLSGYRGKILIDGRDIRTIPRREMAGLIAYIPQLHRASFGYTVAETVLMGAARFHSALSSPSAEDQRRAMEAVEQLGIGHLRDRQFSGISGGEQQLALLARALVQRAGILILDEPTSALDFANRCRVQSMLSSLAGQGYCVIQSNHDPQQVIACATHILAVKEGCLIAAGKADDCLNGELICRLYGVRADILLTDHGKGILVRQDPTDVSP